MSLSVIPSDILDYEILPYRFTLAELYGMRNTSRKAFELYLRVLKNDIYQWVLGREPWFLAIRNDDEFLFADILKAIASQKVVFAEYIGTEDSELVYNNIIIQSMDNVERYLGITTDNIITY